MSDENGWGRGGILQGGRLRFGRKISGRVPDWGSARPIAHSQALVHTLTLSPKPISSTRGMGTPLISLSSPSSTTSPLSSCSPSLLLYPCSLTVPPLHHTLTLSCPHRVTLSGTPPHHHPFSPRGPPVRLLLSFLRVSSPRSLFFFTCIYISCLHLCPIYPEHGLCFFLIICF